MTPPSKPTARVPIPRLVFGLRALAVVIYGLLVFGATVRVFEAGLSCPDWPLCFGELIPEFNLEVTLEWGHRLLAGTVSLGFLTFAAFVLRDSETRARAGLWVAIAAGLLAAQVVLGGLTVRHLLADWSVTLHLVTGNLFLAAILSISERVGAPGTAALTPVRPTTRALGWASLGMWVVQLALGGLVSSNHAGLACTEWPTCNGGVWFPTFTGIVGLQLVHRLGAYTLASLVGAFFWTARTDARLKRTATAAFHVVWLQVLVGVINVQFALPDAVAILHSALADLLGVTLVLSVWRILGRPVLVGAGRLSASSAGAP